MINIVGIITELRSSERYDHFLLKRVGEEIENLRRFVSPDSRTAETLNNTATFVEIIRAAREDSYKYRAGVYDAIVVLAIAAQNAWSRWKNNESAQRPVSAPLSLDLVKNVAA